MTLERCVGEPVSWLRIERYVLAELPDEEMREVRSHLESCRACRACVERARAPRVLPVLPLSPAAPRERQAPPPRRARRRVLGYVTTALAAAAAVLFAIFPRTEREPRYPGDVVRVRGGEVAMTLVRERDGEIVENPAVFGEADRFKVLVTCPPGHDPRFSVFVIQGEAIDLALAVDAVECGNRVALPGAFRIEGAVETTICLAFGPAGRAIREGRASEARDALRGSSVCRALQPVEAR